MVGLFCWFLSSLMRPGLGLKTSPRTLAFTRQNVGPEVPPNLDLRRIEDSEFCATFYKSVLFVWSMIRRVPGEACRVWPGPGPDFEHGAGMFVAPQVIKWTLHGGPQYWSTKPTS